MTDCIHEARLRENALTFCDLFSDRRAGSANGNETEVCGDAELGADKISFETDQRRRTDLLLSFVLVQECRRSKQGYPHSSLSPHMLTQ